MPQRSTRSSLRPPPRGALWTALALSLGGLALSLALARLHTQAHAGIASFCAINETLNCDRVATSSFSVVLGLPVAVWGAFGYGLAAALAAAGLARRRADSTWPAGLLFIVGAVAVTASAALALVSELAIGAWCLLCAGAWAIAVALLASAWRACGAAGMAAAVRADLAAVRASPRRSAAVVAATLAAVALTIAAYPRYWERPRARAGGAALAAGELHGSAAPGAATVVEYSDYECPFCARMHEENRALLAARPEVTLVRRHFPLDPSCNPAVKKSIHPSACSLARAGICAEGQGRFAQMDDALFRNQSEGLPPLELAERLGLDMGRFRACLSSPETEQRLAADIAAGIRDGVRATPSYVVGQTAYAGRLPVERLPPPRTAQSER